MNEAQARQIESIPKGMRAGRRELNEASLIVAVSTAVPESMRTQVREITHVYVEPAARGKRLATALLNFVCQEADANGITLILTARPSDDTGPPEDVLVRWYSKFGFRVLQDSPLGFVMARQVSEKPQVLRVVPNRVGQAVREILSSPVH